MDGLGENGAALKQDDAHAAEFDGGEASAFGGAWIAGIDDFPAERLQLGIGKTIDAARPFGKICEGRGERHVPIDRAIGKESIQILEGGGGAGDFGFSAAMDGADDGVGQQTGREQKPRSATMDFHEIALHQTDFLPYRLRGDLEAGKENERQEPEKAQRGVRGMTRHLPPVARAMPL